MVSNDAHYARPEDRELQDVLVCIRHGLSLEEVPELIPDRPDEATSRHESPLAPGSTS